MKRKKSILQRERTLQRQGLPSKKQKRDVQRQEQGAGPLAGGGQRQHTAGGNKKQPKAPQGLRPTSAVHAQAAYAVKRLLEADASKRGGVTLKGLTLAPHITAKKATYAVTCEALKHMPALQPILERTQLAQRAGINDSLACVLAFELLFGEGLRPTGPAERAVLQQQSDLKQALAHLLDAVGVAGVAELLPAAGPDTPHPRTARVNTLRMGVEEAMRWLRSPPPEHRKWAAVGQLAAVDELLPDLLTFPPGTDLHDHPLVDSGALVLQSKASCMPAHALAPQPGWALVDACAAPGNKTTHLAALMANQGSIVAFEKDPKRLERLHGNAAATGATCIQPELADFLALDPEEAQYSGVQAVLLDPSCSGSGTAFSRMDYLLPSSADRLKGQAAVEHCDERVEALAQFQQSCILQALRFPALRRLVYSTCSVHARENEGVVAAVLEEAGARGFHLEAAFPTWPRRGVAGLVEGAERLVRVDPDLDGTDGFFVAVFAKAEGGQEGGGGVFAADQEQRASPAAARKRKKKQQRQQAAADG